MRDSLTYGTYRLLGALFGPLPPRIGYGIARPAASLLHRYSPRLVQAVTNNMRHVLGPDASEDDLQDVVRRTFVNIAKSHYDLFRLNRLTTEEIRAKTQVEGMDRLKKALAREKGAIMITAHFGNIDLMAQVPATYGVPIMGPVEHTKPERLFQYVLGLRQSHGLRLVPSDGSMMEVYRTLKRGGLIGLPCDRAIADNTREVEFFGSPARLSDGAVRLSLRTGAPLIPGFALRMPDNSFKAEIEPELEWPRTGDKEADITAGMELVVSTMERHISQHPDQWLVAVPVWPLPGEAETLPGGSP